MLLQGTFGGFNSRLLHMEEDDEHIVTITELRTKLEMRSLLLRASIALNISFVGAFVGFVLNKTF